jgi:hypothetical protein
MAEEQPVYWGSIKADTAGDAMASLKHGDRKEMKRFPFDNVVAAGENLIGVKKEVEDVCQPHVVWLQSTDTCADLGRPERNVG